MVSISREDIIQRLKYHQVLNSSENIINESKFKQIILSVFLGWVSLERIKSFWKKEAEEDSVFGDKVERVRPYYHRPFHYVGFGSKTLFISEKEVHERIFFQEFIPQFISRIEEINLIRKTCKLISKIPDACIKSHPNCQATADNFCDGCKEKFADELLKNHSDFLLPLQVKGYTILDLSLETINSFINSDDLIEELEESTCPKCKRFVLDHFSFCPECGQELKRSNSESPINREKILNELMAIYLSKKSGIKCEANKYLGESIVEVDILVSKETKNLGIEGTSIINLDKGYLKKKLTTLLFVDVLLNKSTNSMILWSLDSGGNKQENIEFVKKIAENSFEIMKPLMTSKIMASHSVSINQNDLDTLIKEIDYILNELLIRVNNL